MEKTVLILDYDGTIHDTSAVYEPAFRRAMREMEDLGWLSPREYTSGEIRSWIGYNAKEMWAMFHPEFTEGQRSYASGLIGKYMTAAVDNGESRLYDQAIEVLEELHASYELCYLSNCKDAYLEANRRNHRLDRYYDTFYSSEAFGFLPKEEIFRKIRQPGRQYLAVGDRRTDLQLAKSNGLKFIGCLYGFGDAAELNGADLLISGLKELPEAVRRLLGK